jgi:hypothetical protein
MAEHRIATARKVAHKNFISKPLRQKSQLKIFTKSCPYEKEFNKKIYGDKYPPWLKQVRRQPSPTRSFKCFKGNKG